MKNSLTTLSYAVRPRVIAKFTGQLLLILAALTLAPLAAALIIGEHGIAMRYAIIFAVILLMALPTLRLQAPEHIQINEALVIVALAFMLSPLLMLYPMSAASLSLVDAAFEAISAVTTTGLTTIEDIENRPRTFLFARAWMQWYGGLGIVVLSVALLMGHKLAARRLAAPTSSESMVTTARTHARRMLLIYLALTLSGFVLLLLLTNDVFDSLVYVLASVSTGGFSPYTDSLATYETWAVRYAVLFIALLCAIPLPLYYLAWRQGWRGIVRDIEVRTLLLLTFISATLLTFFIHQASDLGLLSSMAHGVLQSVSAQTTAGFSSLDIASMDDASKIVLILSMFVGGGVGSTAGGIKLLRLLILFRLFQLLLQRTTMPTHAVVEPHLGGKELENDDIQKAMLIILLYIVVIMASWIVFVAFGYPALDGLFEVVSATGTVGLSTGITHSELHPLLKGVLCTDMLLGRVEIVALLIVLYPRTWFGKRA